MKIVRSVVEFHQTRFKKTAVALQGRFFPGLLPVLDGAVSYYNHSMARRDSQPKDSRTTNRSTRGSQPTLTQDATGESHSEHNWQNLFFGQLPLQTETTTFILINCLDIFLTYVLLRFGAREANPIADYFMQRWNFAGAIAFKLSIVAAVVVIAQIVAIKNPRSARALLIAGTLIVGCVVVYSAFLFMKHFGRP